MAMDSRGLAAEWEQSCEVKKRVVSGGKLVTFQQGQPWCVPSRQNAKQNKCLLLPCLERLSSVPDFHLPHLQGLQDELTELYEGFGKTAPSKDIYKNAVELKKLLGFIKRRVNHKEVTKDIEFHELLVTLDPKLKDFIDTYMASRMSRSDSMASANAPDDDLGEDEDPQTQEDFREFALWLNSLDAERPHPSNVRVGGNSQPVEGEKSTSSGETGSSAPSGGAASGEVAPGDGSGSGGSTSTPEVCANCFRSPNDCKCAAIEALKEKIEATKRDMMLRLQKKWAEEEEEKAKATRAPAAIVAPSGTSGSSKGPCLDTAETLPMDIDMAPIEIDDDQPTSPPFIESQWRLGGDMENHPRESPEAEKQPQVLTRARQLQLKERLENEKKDKSKLKNQADEEEADQEREKKTQKAKAKAKAKATARAKAKVAASKKEDSHGSPVIRKKPKNKNKNKNQKEGEDSEKDEDVTIYRSPLPRDVEHEMEMVAREISDEAARKDSSGLEPVVTPKKRLFVASDDEVGDMPMSALPAAPEEPPTKIPKGRGKGKGRKKDQPLPEETAVEEEKGEEIEPEEATIPKAKVKAAKAKSQPKGKAKAKPRPKGKAKAGARRTSGEPPLEDDDMSTAIAKKLDDVATLDFMQVKEYVMGSILKEVTYKYSQFSIYWSRPAVGVKWLRSPQVPQVAYFGFKPKGEVGYNRRMMCNILSAMQFANWLEEQREDWDADQDDRSDGIAYVKAKVKFNALRALGES